MRISVTRSALADAIKTTAVAVNNRPTLPVLSGVVLSAADDLTLSTFDMDSLAIATTPAIIAESGLALVSHRLLAQVVAVCPAGDVLIEDRHGALHIEVGRAKWQLPLMRSEDYPELPKIGERFATVDGGEFAHVADRVAIAASQQQLVDRPLDVVSVGVEDGHLTLVATDGFRLHTGGVASETTHQDKISLVPADRLRAMAKHLDGAVDLHRDGNLFALSTERATFACRLADDSKGWVSWDRLLTHSEQSAKASCTLDREELAAALKQVGGFAVEAAKGHRHITMTFDAVGDLTIEAGTASEGAGSAVVATRHDGQGLRVVVNGEFLADLLTTCSAPAVRITFIGPKKQIGLADGDGPVSQVLIPVVTADVDWLEESVPA